MIGSEPGSGSVSTKPCLKGSSGRARSTGRAHRSTPDMRPRKRGSQTGKNPTDREKLGSKHHVIVDRHGLPLAPPMLTASNVPDVVTLLMMVNRNGMGFTSGPRRCGRAEGIRHPENPRAPGADPRKLSHAYRTKRRRQRSCSTSKRTSRREQGPCRSRPGCGPYAERRARRGHGAHAEARGLIFPLRRRSIAW